LLRDDSSAQAQVRQSFRQAVSQKLQERGSGSYDSIQIGVMETFGTSPPGNRPFGMLVAQAVNRVLVTEPPLRHAATDAFIQSDTASNAVDLRLYVYKQQC